MRKTMSRERAEILARFSMSMNLGQEIMTNLYYQHSEAGSHRDHVAGALNHHDATCSQCAASRSMHS